MSYKHKNIHPLVIAFWTGAILGVLLEQCH